jgi:hypothetical protein
MFIPDPKTATKETGLKKFVVITFLCSHKFHKIANYFSFEVLKKKIFGPIFKKLQNFLPKKLSISSQKYVFGIRDPGSGENLFGNPDLGVKKAPIPDPDPQHCFILHYFICRPSDSFVVGRWWDRTQDCCDFCIGSQML